MRASRRSAEVGAGLLGGVGRLLDAGSIPSPISAGTGASPGGEQPLDVVLGEVEPAERILGVRVRRAARGDGRADARLDDAEPAQQVGERRIAALSHALPRVSRIENCRPGWSSVPPVKLSWATGSSSGSSARPSRPSCPCAAPCPSLLRRGASPLVDATAIFGSSSTGGPAAATRPASNGAVTTRSSDGFSSPPSADQTSASERSLGGGSAIEMNVLCGDSARLRGARRGHASRT